MNTVRFHCYFVDGTFFESEENDPDGWINPIFEKHKILRQDVFCFEFFPISQPNVRAFEWNGEQWEKRKRDIYLKCLSCEADRVIKNTDLLEGYWRCAYCGQEDYFYVKD